MTLKVVLLLTAIIMAILSVAAMADAQPHPRHVASHHAHLVKHARTLDVIVHIPKSAFKKAPLRAHRAKKRHK